MLSSLEELLVSSSPLPSPSLVPLEALDSLRSSLPEALDLLRTSPLESLNPSVVHLSAGV